MVRELKIVGLLILLAGCNQSQSAAEDAKATRDDVAKDTGAPGDDSTKAEPDALKPDDRPPGCPVCGNGKIECDEVCDNNAVEERCEYGSPTCRVCGSDCKYTIGFGSICGDGVVDTADGEECDDGRQTRLCPHLCRISDCAGVQDLTGYEDDYDCDGVPDETDNCVTVSNADQLDSDEDEVGDLCEFLSACERCVAEWVARSQLHPPPAPDAGLQDAGGGCGCGGGGVIWCGTQCAESDRYVDDYDHDGWEDDFDNCPFVPNEEQVDSDGDGVGDVCDPVPCTPELRMLCQ